MICQRVAASVLLTDNGQIDMRWGREVAESALQPDICAQKEGRTFRPGLWYVVCKVRTPFLVSDIRVFTVTTPLRISAVTY